jgi:hypothetical protein
MELKSAWEIALEKNEDYGRLSVATDELLEHVTLLEECWDAIHPSDAPGRPAPGHPERLAA